MPMKSQRLTQELTQRIADRIFHHKYGVTYWNRDQLARKDIAAFNKKYAMRALNVLVPPNLMRRMKQMPDGYFIMSGELRNLVLNPENDGSSWKKYVDVQLPRQYPMPYTYAAGCYGGERMRANFSDRDLLAEMDAEFPRWTFESDWDELISVINQFNTTKQMIEAWPESAQYVPFPATQKKTKLIVPPTNVNEIFNLTK